MNGRALASTKSVSWVALAFVLGAGACGSVGDKMDGGSGSGGKGGSAAGGSGGSSAGGSGGSASGGSGGSGGSSAGGSGGGTGGSGGATDGGSGGAGGGSDAAVTDGAITDGPRDADDGCARPRSCSVIHQCMPAAVSGQFQIYPGGNPDGGGVSVHCDMTTAGGGWTVIFLASSINYNSSAVLYTVPNQAIRDNATEALMAFRNLNLNMQASDWASFTLPATWRAQSPLTVPSEDLSVTAVVNGGLPAQATLRFGDRNFGSLCGDAWVPATPYGRVCLQGTAAAYFSGFSTDSGDFCSLSNQAYSTRACSDAARFSIAVR